MQTKLTVVFALVSGLAASHALADNLGRFTRPSTGTTVDFFDCGGNLCGKIVAVKDASHKSEVGKMIVNGAKPSGASSWKGDLFDPESGKTYGGSIALVSGGLKLQGGVMGFLCSGEVWTRVK